MTISEAFGVLVKQLAHLYDKREAVNICNLVMEHITGTNRTDNYLNRKNLISDEQKKLFDKYTEELLQHKPVQYVLNECWFAGIKFYVNENVLIPRPETEELVDWLINDIKQANPEKCEILDIGTGSGCIAVLIKKRLPAITMHALDISEEAILVARQNAKLQNTPINFYHLNILDENDSAVLPQINIIISNPPYIKKSEASTMHKNILDFEPHTALFINDEDPFIFYKSIAVLAKKKLKINGLIYLEINESAAESLTDLFITYGYKVELRNDLQGKPRMIKLST